MTPEQLKASILQYAIQGKLVEQRPEEGTGEELYQQIQVKKQTLIKEGKVKKEKPFSKNPAYQDYPFDIPDTWKFVRFGELLITRDSERVPVSVSDRNKRAKIYDYYGASGIIDKIDDYLFDDELLLIGEDGANLLSRSTPIAFIAKGKYWVNNHAHVLDACCNLNLNYICYHINAISLAPYVTGTAQPKMNQENMNAIWIALPPLEEQHRIVAKIEELLPYVDRYAVAYEKLEQFNTKFPENMKKSILRYAIQGKLVEQRAEEGTGEELYQQIQAEKQRLIQEKKIKKEKPLAEISEDEIPFDIPESWKWGSFSSVIELQSGQDMTPDKYNANHVGIPYITGASNITNGDVLINRWTECGKAFAYKGDVLFTCKGTVGTMAVLQEPKVHIARQIMAIRPIGSISVYYIQVVLDTLVSSLKAAARV
ncbi:MAG: restriction endonuclease subunit S [Evtepia gabavorous]